MHLVVVTQYGIAQSMGNSGSLMRFNMSGRIVVGASNPDGLRAAFDEAVPTQLANHLTGTIPGRCLYAQLNADHGQTVTPGQLYLITQADAQTITNGEGSGHDPTDFDELAARQLLTEVPETTSRRGRR
jgi:hypothetical protein